MNLANETRDASIRYTVTLEDGTLISRTVGGDRLDFACGEEKIFPALEAALSGVKKGETRRFTLSPAHDPSLKLDVSRLALSLDHPGEKLILTVEILKPASSPHRPSGSSEEPRWGAPLEPVLDHGSDHSESYDPWNENNSEGRNDGGSGNRSLL